MVKHRIKHRKLGRTGKHRWAMLRNMVTSLIHHGRIETTVPKAKELRRVADNMVTLAKRGDQHAKRQANAVVRDYVALHKLWSELGPNYQERPGGYTRILKTRNRRGDGAPMAIIEFVDRPGEIRASRRPWDESWVDTKRLGTTVGESDGVSGVIAEENSGFVNDNSEGLEETAGVEVEPEDAVVVEESTSEETVDKK